MDTSNVLKELTPGFLEATSRGEVLNQPVLLVISQSNTVGGQSSKILLGVTDGTKESSSVTHLMYTSVFLISSEVLHGEQLVGKLIALVHYTILNMKDRRYPVVTNLRVLSTPYNLQTLHFSSYKLPSDTSSFSPTKHKPMETTRENRVGPYVASSSGPIARQSTGLLTNISMLNQFSSHWIVKARVSVKSEIRKFSNQRGEGKLFNAHLIDNEGSEIRGTFFGKAVDRFFPLLNEGNVYTFSRGKVFASNKQYNPLSHPCELRFDEHSLIVPLSDDSSIPEKVYQIKSIASILKMDINCTVDVIGVVVNHMDLVNVVIKSTGKERAKRDFTLSDGSGSIDFTLWGETANEKLSDEFLGSHPIAFIKGAKVGDYMRKKLDGTSTTEIDWNPRMEEAVELAGRWRRHRELNEPFDAPTQTPAVEGASYSIEDITRECINISGGGGDSCLYFSLYCTVVDVSRDKFYWMGCPKCKRKIVDMSLTSTQHHRSTTNCTPQFCSSCNQKWIPVCNWLLNLTVSDWTGTLKCTAIGEYGEQIMNTFDVSLPELVDIHRGASNSTHKNVAATFDELQYTDWKLRLCGRYETFNDETTLKYKIVNSKRLDVCIKQKIEEQLRFIRTSSASS